MNKYIELFMRYLVLECACVTSRTGKNGGIYEYVQCEFAYNSCRLEGCELSKKNVCNIYEHGIIYADEQEQIFRAEDIITVDGHFAALKYAISNCMGYHIGISRQDIKEIHRLLYCGCDMQIDHDFSELTSKVPCNLKEISDYHAEWLKQGRDSKVARIITFIQCLNANIVPFIIHEENKAEYEDNCKETISLEIFFRKEQLRFYDETEAMVTRYSIYCYYSLKNQTISHI